MVRPSNPRRSGPTVQRRSAPVVTGRTPAWTYSCHDTRPHVRRPARAQLFMHLDEASSRRLAGRARSRAGWPPRRRSSCRTTRPTPLPARRRSTPGLQAAPRRPNRDDPPRRAGADLRGGGVVRRGVSVEYESLTGACSTGSTRRDARLLLAEPESPSTCGGDGAAARRAQRRVEELLLPVPRACQVPAGARRRGAGPRGSAWGGDHRARLHGRHAPRDRLRRSKGELRAARHGAETEPHVRPLQARAGHPHER